MGGGGGLGGYCAICDVYGNMVVVPDRVRASVAMKDLSHALLLACTLSPAVVAQTVDLAALTAGSMVAVCNGGQQTTTLPAGPMAAQGYQLAVAGAGSLVAVADLTWTAAASPYAIDVYLTASVQVPALPGVATSGPFEVMITVAFPTQISTTIELSNVTVATPGTVSPTARADVFDDGTYELDETTAGTATLPWIPIGPTGLVISCLLDAASAVEGSVVAGLHVRILPGETESTLLFPGCGLDYVVSPRLDGNVDFAVGNVQAGINLAVFGLSTQPLLLGSQVLTPGGPAMPCVLLPQPDLIVFLPAPTAETLVIPPAARPFVLFSQGVRIDGSGFTTSPAYQIIGT